MTTDPSNGPLGLKARGNAATAALRTLVECGHLDEAPAIVRDEITQAAIRLATSVGAQDRDGAIIAAEIVLDRAQAWLSRRPPRQPRRGLR